MTFLVVVIVLVSGAYFGGATVSGMRRTSATLASVRPGVGALTVEFEAAPDEVIAAYAAAAPKMPGMGVADRAPGRLLVDLRPTSRILGGSFGLLIVVEAKPGPAGAQTTIVAQPKVPWAVLANQHAALVHAERALRMEAKRGGLRESVGAPRA